MHPLLALLCFVRILFGRKLPAEAIAFLPEGAAPPRQLPSSTPETKVVDAADAAAKAEKAAEKAANEVAKAAAKAADKRTNVAQNHRDGALALLALLQREGRLVDFLREPLDGFSDGDIGAAARDVHRGCAKVLAQHLTLEPVMPGEEEAKVAVPKGFDPAEIRLIGEAKGEPPYKGTLRHHGWRVVDAKLPQLADGVDRTVIAPAEVELGA